MRSIRDDLQDIYGAAVDRVDPYRMISERVGLDGSLLRILADSDELRFDLGAFSRVIVLGAGKAAAKMARAIESILGPRITDGLIAVKRGHVESLETIRIIEAGHPVPDAESERAAREIADICRGADEHTFILNLVSGGGSACLCLPLEWTENGTRRALRLRDKQATTSALLSCGADIDEINCVRKHLSGIKGGRLAEIMYPAVSVSIILSDVVGDRLDAIASGLTVGDATTYDDALAVLRKYGLEREIPSDVLLLLAAGSRGEVAETPKPGDAVFRRSHNVLLGSNVAALGAAAERASALGYRTIVLSSQITGEAREVAKVYAAIGSDVCGGRSRLPDPPLCVLGGGETTVTLRGDGLGGRNQEMALSFLQEIARRPDLAGVPGDRLGFLSAGTDGNDGPTDAAGAFADGTALEYARGRGLRVEDFLHRNDSYHFFQAAGALFKPGPTNTNVCDLQLLIVRP